MQLLEERVLVREVLVDEHEGVGARRAEVFDDRAVAHRLTHEHRQADDGSRRLRLRRRSDGDRLRSGSLGRRGERGDVCAAERRMTEIPSPPRWPG